MLRTAFAVRKAAGRTRTAAGSAEKAAQRPWPLRCLLFSAPFGSRGHFVPPPRQRNRQRLLR